MPQRSTGCQRQNDPGSDLYHSSPERGERLSAAELMQWRWPVGSGPSSKTWPRWALQRLQSTSVRRMNRL